MITPEKLRDAYWRALSTPPFNDVFARIADALNDGKCRCVDAECSHADTQRCLHCGCPNPVTPEQVAEEEGTEVCTVAEHAHLKADLERVNELYRASYDLKVRKLMLENGTLLLESDSNIAITILLAEFHKLLEQYGNPPNHLEIGMTLGDEIQEPLNVTIQRIHGKSPGQMLSELRLAVRALYDCINGGYGVAEPDEAEAAAWAPIKALIGITPQSSKE